MQISYLLALDDQRLVIMQRTKASKFRLADTYLVWDLIEAYRPFPDANQTILRHSWRYEQIGSQDLL